MPAYGNQDAVIAGLPYGLIQNVINRNASEAIGFGKPVFGYKGDNRALWTYKKDTAKMVYSADFITSNSVAVTIDGVALSATVFATDHLTTINAIIAKITALAGCEAVLDPADTNNRTILVRKKGVAAFVASSTVTLGASQATMAATYGSGQVYLGFSMFTQKVGGQYDAGDEVNIMFEGGIAAVAASGAKANGPVYLTAAGVPTSTATSNQLLDGVFFVSNEADTAGFAMVQTAGDFITMPYGDKF